MRRLWETEFALFLWTSSGQALVPLSLLLGLLALALFFCLVIVCLVLFRPALFLSLFGFVFVFFFFSCFVFVLCNFHSTWMENNFALVMYVLRRIRIELFRWKCIYEYGWRYGSFGSS